MGADERSSAARTVADGKWVRRIVRTAADGVGAREWLEMDGEKKPLVMSELGCADGGRQMGGENCADGCGGRGCEGVAAETKALEMRERGCADGCGREMGGENFADGCGRRGCKGVAGNSWGEEAAGDERAWLRGRLRTGNGCGELRGRLRTAWVQRSGWKWVGRRTRCSPRTRMLTRMLMYICSHSEPFSAIVCLNSLVYTYFPCDQSAVWSGQCRVWSVECKV